MQAKVKKPVALNETISLTKQNNIFLIPASVRVRVRVRVITPGDMGDTVS